MPERINICRILVIHILNSHHDQAAASQTQFSIDRGDLSYLAHSPAQLPPATAVLLQQQRSLPSQLALDSCRRNYKKAAAHFTVDMCHIKPTYAARSSQIWWQDGVLKHSQTYEIMTPESVGLADGNNLVLGKHSGKAAYRNRLEQLGYKDLSADQVCMISHSTFL